MRYPGALPVHVPLFLTASSARGPLFLTALSAHAPLLRRLQARGLSGRVHSVFAHVLNLQTVEGKLVSLASRALDDAPGTLVVDVADFLQSHAAPGDAVSVTAGTLHVGQRLAVRFGTARAWQRALPPYPADIAMLRANLATARSILQRGQREGAQPPVPGQAYGRGLAPSSTPVPSSALVAAARQRLARHVDALCTALAAADAASTSRHAHAMLGLGPGLTPAGDDVLAGVFAVIALPRSPLAPLLDTARDVAAAAGVQTNAISAAMLDAAVRGEVRERIVALLDSLLRGPVAAVPARMAPVLSIGASSGRDLCAGIAVGLEASLAAAPIGAAGCAA
jgi:hypothetical protein